mgnify:CR=1 FL=1
MTVNKLNKTSARNCCGYVIPIDTDKGTSEATGGAAGPVDRFPQQACSHLQAAAGHGVEAGGQGQAQMLSVLKQRETTQAAMAEVTQYIQKMPALQQAASPVAGYEKSYVILGLLLFGFLHLAAIALISPPSTNRALPLRSYVTIAWLLFYIVLYVV